MIKKEKEKIQRAREEQRLKIKEEKQVIAKAFEKVKSQGKFEIPKELKNIMPSVK